MYRALVGGYQWLINLGTVWQDYLLLSFRLLWGFGFLMAGFGKIQNISPVIDFFESINIPYPAFQANLVAWVECIGGGLLIIGLATRLAAVPLMITMFVALITAHKKAMFNLVSDPQTVLKQAAFTYFLVSAVLFSFGPGRISLDALLERWLPRPGTKKMR